LQSTTNLTPLVQRHWRLLASSALVAGLVAFALTSLMAPSYQARLQLLVGPLNTDLRTLQASGELSRTYAELATSRPVLDAAIRQAGVRTTADALRAAGAVTATSNQITRIVDVAVEDTDPRGAARLANALGARIKQVTTDAPSENEEVVDAFVRKEAVTALPEDEQRELERAARESLGHSLAGTVRIVDPATTPTTPAAPASKLITVLAALLGLLVAGVFVLVRASSAERVEDERDLAEVAGAAVLGTVERSREASRALTVERRPGSPGADRYRVLAANAGFL
jgi:capsular polysaccharide biosynthesis protein